MYIDWVRYVDNGLVIYIESKISVSWSQSCPVRERISIFLKELFWFRLKNMS